ncbi:MAG: CotH kinase family protein [Planctomycetota bacterium]|nr:CotH kinase family protein [Planctomycetota bacterium]
MPRKIWDQARRKLPGSLRSGNGVRLVRFACACAALVAPLGSANVARTQETSALSEEQNRRTHASDAITDAENLFGLDRVIDVDLRISAEEWAKLQPPAGTRLDAAAVGSAFGDLIGDAIMGGNFRSEKSTRPGLAGYLGLDHQYGRADVTIDGETIRGVGLRYKGNGSFLVGHYTGKYSFKVDFNEYREGVSFRGLRKLNLNNEATDPSMMREALSYEIFRAAGVVCSRVNFARVYLTVGGGQQREPKGLYTIVEQVDKRFLKDRFGDATGLLLKPSTFGVFRYLGEDWSKYEVAYVPKNTPTEAQQQRVIAFAKLLHQGNDGEFEATVEEYLDVDQFLRFLAINVLLSNLDSFLGGTQNYYVYLDTGSNRFQFLPWDMDISFGAFDMEGTPSSRRNLSIDQPQTHENRLIERVLAIGRHKQNYHEYLRQYLDTLFAQEKLYAQIDHATAILRPVIGENGKEAGERFEKAIADSPSLFEPHALKFFVTQRRESVREQLANERTGDTLGNDVDLMELVQWWTAPRVGVLVALPVVLLLNGSGWLWGIISGFRGGVVWGLLNAAFFPFSPLAYGFVARREKGRRAAWWVLLCVASMVAWLLLANSVLVD